MAMNCTCGANFGVEESSSQDMEASFVHLNLLEDDLTLRAGAQCSSTDWTKDLESWLAGKDSQPYSWSFVLRLKQGLERDTERLNRETAMYKEHLQRERLRAKSRQYQQQSFGNDGFTSGRTDQMARVKESFEQEIEDLQVACLEMEQELRDLQKVRLDIQNKSIDLRLTTDNVMQAQNEIALAAVEVENEQEQLYRVMASLQGEVERLSSLSIRLPSIPFDLQVDQERGLRYPLINQHRLAFRPKGDVHSDEIQTAWSLAAQLLLAVATVFQFQSRHWRIVPLMDSAKLIFYPPTNEQHDGGVQNPISYTLGDPKGHNGRALLAWNALLHQVAAWVLTSSTNKLYEDSNLEFPKIPFEMTRNSIGSMVISSLTDSNDAGWSKAIHCMSCNLLWLSQCASIRILQQVRRGVTLSSGPSVPTELPNLGRM